MCIKERGYFQISWRIVDVNICIKHRIELVSGCQNCLKKIEIKDLTSLTLCPYCGHDLCKSVIVNVEDESLFQQEWLQNTWKQLLLPNGWHLSATELAARLLYLLEGKPLVFNRENAKRGTKGLVNLATLLQHIRSTLSTQRVLHISTVINILQKEHNTIAELFEMSLPTAYENSIRAQYVEKRVNYACQAPWCLDYGQKGSLTKSGTSFKKKANGESLLYYMYCGKCGCEYAVTREGEIQERSYFIKAYYLLKAYPADEITLVGLSKLTKLTQDQIRRFKAYVRSRGSQFESLGYYVRNGSFPFNVVLLDRFVTAIQSNVRIKQIKLWIDWINYDQFLTYRFHQEVIVEMLNQGREGYHKGKKIHLEQVKDFLKLMIKREDKISINSVAKGLRVVPETLRLLGANKWIGEARKEQRDLDLLTRKQSWLERAKYFFFINANTRISSEELYKYLGISRTVLYRIAPDVSKLIGGLLKQHNLNLMILKDRVR